MIDVNVQLHKKQEAIIKVKSQYENSVFELDERLHWLKALRFKVNEELNEHKKRLNIYFNEIQHSIQ